MYAGGSSVEELDRRVQLRLRIERPQVGGIFLHAGYPEEDVRCSIGSCIMMLVIEKTEAAACRKDG